MTNAVQYRPDCSQLLKNLDEFRVNRQELNRILTVYRIPVLFYRKENEILLNVFQTKKSCVF